jgi:hypothetical protein
MFEDLTTQIAGGGIISTIIALVWGLLTKVDLNAALKTIGFTDPLNTTITQNPKTKYLSDMAWKVGEEQYKEILSGLGVAEQNSVRAFIMAVEAIGTNPFNLETSKGVYIIENGYIEKRPMDNIDTTEAAVQRVIRNEAAVQRVIRNEANQRVGVFEVSQLEQRVGVKANVIDPHINELFVAGKFKSYGTVIVGVKVGSEDIQQSTLEAKFAGELETVHRAAFKLYNYSPTIADTVVTISVKMGYRSINPDGTEYTVWTSSKDHMLDIVR